LIPGMAFSLTELGRDALELWCLRALSTPERARIVLSKVSATAVAPTLSLRGCASLFEFFVSYTASERKQPLREAACFRQTARELASTRSFRAFLSANGGLFFRRGLVAPDGDAPLPNVVAPHGRFFVPSWCANQWCSSKTPRISVAYTDDASPFASWYAGTYNPVTGTVAFDDGSEAVLDRKLDEFAIGEAVGWVQAHPDAIFFRADGIPFLYSNQRADMTEFLEDLRFLVERMGICSTNASFPVCRPGTTVRAYIEHPDVNYSVC